MGLNIRLLHGDRCVINGAVIECKSQRTTISVENHAHVIRAGDILQQEQVKTPLQRVYFSVQLMLIDPARADDHRLHFNTYMAEALQVFENPEVLGELTAAVRHVDQGDPYKALVALRPSLRYERALLDGMAEAGPVPPPPRQPAAQPALS